MLERANRVVTRIGDQHLFATCCYVVLDPADGALSWASAGHLAPLRVDASPDYLRTEVGPPLGVQADARFPESSGTLGRGELLVLFPDGLVEDRIRPIKTGLEQLAAVATACIGRSPSEAADLLVAAAEDRSDDLALISARLGSEATPT